MLGVIIYIKERVEEREFLVLVLSFYVNRCRFLWKYRVGKILEFCVKEIIIKII